MTGNSQILSKILDQILPTVYNSPEWRMSDYVGRFSRIEQLPDLLDGPTSSQINRVALMWASLRAVLSDN